MKARIGRLPGMGQAAVILLAVAGLAAGPVAAMARAHTATAAQGREIRGPVTDQYGDFFRRWLHEDARWIITQQEKDQFLRLTNDQQRLEFVRQFWARRNPNPGSAENAFEKEHYRRIGFADEYFGQKDEPGWKSDRGHVYIVYGAPDSIEKRQSAGQPAEVWHYRTTRIEAPVPMGAKGAASRPSFVTQKDVNFLFVDRCGCGEYELEARPPQ